MNFDIRTKIEELTLSERDNLVSLVLSKNRIYQLQFILFNLDRFNSLDENILEEKDIKDKIKNFLSQRKFNILRDIILRNTDDKPASRKEFLEYEIASARNCVLEGSATFIDELKELEDEYYIKERRKLKLKALYEKDNN